MLSAISFPEIWKVLSQTAQDYALQPFSVQKCTGSGKFFDQLEQLHKLFERGTLTEEQFEKRKQVILDCLDELASE